MIFCVIAAPATPRGDTTPAPLHDVRLELRRERPAAARFFRSTVSMMNILGRLVIAAQHGMGSGGAVVGAQQHGRVGGRLLPPCYRAAVAGCGEVWRAR